MDRRERGLAFFEGPTRISVVQPASQIRHTESSAFGQPTKPESRAKQTANNSAASNGNNNSRR